MERYLQSYIQKDLSHKIVLLSGPRQVGKTTLSKSITKSFDYFNWDVSEDRISLKDKSWDRKKELIIFDEIHKMPKFKSWLKGIYDKEGVHPRIIVTGSARLDIAKKMGDSLAGRFFPYRLHPLDLWELSKEKNLDDTYQRLTTCSGFPEPYLSNDPQFYRRWSLSHLDLILRQDLLDLENVRSILKIETLIALLRTRVGSSISFSNLARDLEVDAKTVKNWLTILENLFVIFKVIPFHKNIARSILKEPKYYFYDVVQVEGSEGVVFENFVALALKKQIDYIQDTQGIRSELHYLRTKDGNEIDFYVDIQEHAGLMIECKLSDDRRSKDFSTFIPKIKNVHSIQLVKNLTREKTYPDGLEIRSALKWLKNINLLQER
ncbi:MAG: ATP-binding protein [Bdellovibrionales bacterium]|nr:ATP-binding protein [Bdellovibrionales bacterium]